MYLGLTAMIRNIYNPFADPVLLFFVITISASVVPIRLMLRVGSKYAKLWEVTVDDAHKVDIGTVNRLDHSNNVKKLVRNI